MPTTRRTQPTTRPTKKPITKPPYIEKNIAFDGESGVAFPDDTLPWEETQGFLSSGFTIKLNVKPKASDGLIFFQGNQNAEFVSLGSTFFQIFFVLFFVLFSQ